MSKLNISFALAFFLFLGIDLTAGRSSYGEFCDNAESIYCDSTKDLMCKNHTCACLKEDSMLYNETQDRCLVLSGERCHYVLAHVDDFGFEHQQWVENFLCVQNASCDSDGFCKCDNNTYENSQRICTPKKSHGDSCTRNEECNAWHNLICMEGQCVCNKTESIFDPNRNKCAGKVGQSCIKFGGCTRNAFCTYDALNTKVEGTTKNHAHACRCQEGYEASPDGICRGKHKAVSCHPKFSPCVEGLICSSGKCDCIFPELQSFNETMEMCISHLHSPCSEIVNGVKKLFPCETNAECRSATDNDFPECLCKKGYVESKGSHCKRIHGARCESHDDCDQVNGLTCKNGKCSCGDLHEYEKADDTCRGLAGARCKIGKQDACVEGAICKPVRDDEVKGVCRCNIKFYVDENRKCNEEINDSVDVSSEEVKS